jgi:hypothetical protein
MLRQYRAMLEIGYASVSLWKPEKKRNILGLYMTNYAVGCFLILTNLSYRREVDKKTTVHSF